VNKYFRRLTARTVLIPVALLAIGFGSAVPASAAPLTTPPAVRPALVFHIHLALPDSLNW
jgi:hypothetical protein